MATRTCACLAGAGSPGLPLPLFQHLPFAVPQYLSAHGGHAAHFPLLLFSLLLLFPSSSLGTWLMYSLSQGAAYVIAHESWNRPITNKSWFLQKPSFSGAVFARGHLPAFSGAPGVAVAWLGPCPLGRAEAGFSGGRRVGR